jgi:hypothetical protein
MMRQWMLKAQAMDVQVVTMVAQSMDVQVVAMSDHVRQIMLRDFIIIVLRVVIVELLLFWSLSSTSLCV